MSIFDKAINDFLKTQEEDHKCNICNKPMEFKKQHGYFQCKTCKSQSQHPIIKAPQTLVKFGNKAIKLFWTRCPDCMKNNVTDESQQSVLRVIKTKVVTVQKDQGGKMIDVKEHVFDREILKKNTKQEKISCTHCNAEFYEGKKK